MPAVPHGGAGRHNRAHQTDSHASLAACTLLSDWLARDDISVRDEFVQGTQDQGDEEGGPYGDGHNDTPFRTRDPHRGRANKPVAKPCWQGGVALTSLLGC